MKKGIRVEERRKEVKKRPRLTQHPLLFLYRPKGIIVHPTKKNTQKQYVFEGRAFLINGGKVRCFLLIKMERFTEKT